MRVFLYNTTNSCTKCTVHLLTQKWINPLHKLYSCHHLYRGFNTSVQSADYRLQHVVWFADRMEANDQNNRNFLCENKHDNWPCQKLSMNVVTTPVHCKFNACSYRLWPSVALKKFPGKLRKKSELEYSTHISQCNKHHTLMLMVEQVHKDI